MPVTHELEEEGAESAHHGQAGLACIPVPGGAALLQLQGLQQLWEA